MVFTQAELKTKAEELMAKTLEGTITPNERVLLGGCINDINRLARHAKHKAVQVSLGIEHKPTKKPGKKVAHPVWPPPVDTPRAIWTAELHKRLVDALLAPLTDEDRARDESPFGFMLADLHDAMESASPEDLIHMMMRITRKLVALNPHIIDMWWPPVHVKAINNLLAKVKEKANGQ